MHVELRTAMNWERTTAPLLAALGFVALVPAAGVLWFMSVAMRNERLAVQEQLAAVYSNHLVSLQPRVTAWVKDRQGALSRADAKSPAEIFAAAIRANVADSVIVCDAAGKPLYPVATTIDPVATENAELARAQLARAVELLRAGEPDRALAQLVELTGDSNLRRATGPQGILMVPSAQLLILKTLAGLPPDSRNAHAFRYEQTLADLVARLNDYSDSALLSSQRRFLMREVKALASDAATFPTFAAEELAARYIEHEPATRADPRPSVTHKVQPTPLAQVWQLSSPDRTVIALFREERLRTELAAALRTPALSDAHATIRAPGDPVSADKRVPSLAAGEVLPGWTLALTFNGTDPLAAASARQTRFYLWSGFLLVLAIAIIALLVARYVAAQMRLARLKDELVSTVSHELKTPLASMRALLDTLSAGRYRDSVQMQRYLMLATKENLRLSQLIENFLVFSRLARGQQQFRFAPLAPPDLVRRAVEAVGEKLTSPPCRLTTEIPGDLPPICGDADALCTVLVNLLDNAYKYTRDEKQIEVEVHAEAAHVVFAVTDNGIGIAPQEQARVFERFYQVDQSLTRQRGGCGLGLSIVQSIVRAHGGSVEVNSVPGQGSTFRVKIPAMAAVGPPRLGAAVSPCPSV